MINPALIGHGISGAVFDGPDRKYRYALWRIWQPGGRLLLFVGLNPSTAKEYRDDPTIIRLVGFAKAWGFGGLFAGNLFSLVTAYPSVLWAETSMELPDCANDMALLKMRSLSSMVLVGWGNGGLRAGDRPAYILALLDMPVHCISTTAAGEPHHPLRTLASSKPILYSRN